ncbi:hypothetical protein RISK_004614 [Rhodopirellula islandica]|uniref:Uncharacterized protein n=1 Tax=Rhodopirellula islandica TaxID=595434 RepID=A0A0J1B999_RHOIS|nr:hypothetical protein RISK_004614 [Rhodopirellula islandica]
MEVSIHRNIDGPHGCHFGLVLDSPALNLGTEPGFTTD